MTKTVVETSRKENLDFFKDDRHIFFRDNYIAYSTTKIQWNLSIADMLYSGHFSITDTLHNNGWNHGHSFIGKPLYSAHLSIALTILWNQ